MAEINSIDRRMTGIGSLHSQPRLRRAGLAVSFAILGALSFWLPDVAIRVHAGPDLDSKHALAITLLAPAMFLLAYVAARKFALKQAFNWVGAAMLLGVWVSGGLFMTLAAMFSGSEFIGATGVWRLIVIVLSVIPIVTYILAAYDGSLFALLAVTVGGVLFCGVRSIWILSNSAGTASKMADRTSEAHEQSKAA